MRDEENACGFSAVFLFFFFNFKRVIRVLNEQTTDRSER